MNNIDISYVRSKYKKLYKLFTILPGATSILIITITLSWYSIFLFNEQNNYQTIVFMIAIFILLYYIWWVIRWFEYMMFIFMSAFKISKYNRLNFWKILFSNVSLNNEERFYRSQLKQDVAPNEIIHRFIVPTYKENEKILNETIKYIEESNYDKKKFAITIAWEEWDKENFMTIAPNLINKYKNTFGYMNYTIHPKWVEGEIAWKWANITYSAKNEYENILKTFDTTADKILVTTLDADTNIDKEYPNILTHTYISTSNRKKKSYQPMIFFFNNFWDAPFFSRIISLWNTFWILFNSLKKFGMRNFSTHAQPLDALIELKFWSYETIVEDWHQYWRSYFWFQWDYECVPIYTKVYQDSNMNNNIMLTAKAQYNQIRRWAHWAEDIPYVMCQWVDKWKSISFARTLYESLRLFEWTILWSTLHIILMVWLTFSFIKDIQLSTYISLWGTISFLIKISFLMAIMIIYLQLYFSPWYKLKNIYEKIFQVIKFLIVYIWLAWPTLVIFSWLPAIHTQIALMLGKPMKKFNITKKVRKE